MNTFLTDRDGTNPEKEREEKKNRLTDSAHGG